MDLCNPIVSWFWRLCEGSRVLTSYHAGISIWLLMVMGLGGAWGKRNRYPCVGGNDNMVGKSAKSYPSAPNPCSHKNDVVTLGEVSTLK